PLLRFYGRDQQLTLGDELAPDRVEVSFIRCQLIDLARIDHLDSRAIDIRRLVSINFRDIAIAVKDIVSFETWHWIDRNDHRGGRTGIKVVLLEQREIDIRDVVASQNEDWLAKPIKERVVNPPRIWLPVGVQHGRYAVLDEMLGQHGPLVTHGHVDVANVFPDLRNSFGDERRIEIRRHRLGQYLRERHHPLTAASRHDDCVLDAAHHSSSTGGLSIKSRISCFDNRSVLAEERPNSNGFGARWLKEITKC